MGGGACQLTAPALTALRALSSTRRPTHATHSRHTPPPPPPPRAQVNLKLFQPAPGRRRTLLLFVFRDRTRTPLERLIETWEGDLARMWDAIAKPPQARGMCVGGGRKAARCAQRHELLPRLSPARTHTPPAHPPTPTPTHPHPPSLPPCTLQYDQYSFKDFFEVAYASLPNYEDRPEDFVAEATLLRRQFTEEGEGGGRGVGCRGQMRERASFACLPCLPAPDSLAPLVHPDPTPSPPHTPSPPPPPPPRRARATCAPAARSCLATRWG